MDTKELVKRARQGSSELEALADRQAAALVREVFRQIGEDIAATEEGVVKVTGLGWFRIRQVERERDGQKVVEKRTSFRLPTPKPEADGEPGSTA